MFTITKRVKLVGKKGFAAAALDPKHETYVFHIASLNSAPLVAFLNVHLFQRTQISRSIVKKILTKVSAKYSDFADIFSWDFAIKLPKHIKINTYTIDLEKSKFPTYGPIYNLRSVELKNLKTYIETNLANGFICPSKFPASASILFKRKPNRSLCLCVNYHGLNNITIKNWYSFPLIDEFFDHLGRAKQFIHLV